MRRRAFLALAACVTPLPDALTYNLGSFLRALASPEPIRVWSLTSLREMLFKIGATAVGLGRFFASQMVEGAIFKKLFTGILRIISELRPRPGPAPA